MRILGALFCLSALTTGAFAQGLINFGNQPVTLISYGYPGSAVPLPAGAPGSFYFGLLTSATATGPFSFASVYGTNSSTAGRIAQNGATVIGWLPGATMFYEVAGWSANFGVTFNPAWPT